MQFVVRQISDIHPILGNFCALLRLQENGRLREIVSQTALTVQDPEKHSHGSEQAEQLVSLAEQSRLTALLNPLYLVSHASRLRPEKA